MMDLIPAKIHEHIKNYQTKMNAIPKNILFYRDGVGENQLDLVLRRETERIKRELEEIYKENAPKITQVIVTKRLDERFFQEGDNRMDNLRGGTVIDNTVTKHERINFYLQCQTVNMGTARATHYDCIMNEMNLSEEKLHQITYNLSYLYFNWMGAIRVPSVLQEAHKCAYQEGMLFNDDKKENPDEEMNPRNESIRQKPYFF